MQRHRAVGRRDLQFPAGFGGIHSHYFAQNKDASGLPRQFPDVAFQPFEQTAPLQRGPRIVLTRRIRVGNRLIFAELLPMVAESGYPGFEASLWLAVFAPAGTPAPVLDRLQKEIRAVVQAPDSAAVIGKAGAEPVSSSPAELAAIVKDGIAKYAKVVKMADVKPE